jgi:hypothetical protein
MKSIFPSNFSLQLKEKLKVMEMEISSYIGFQQSIVKPGRDPCSCCAYCPSTAKRRGINRKHSMLMIIFVGLG